MNVGNICTKDVDVVRETDSVRVAAERMHDHKVGSLTPGKEADLIMLDARRINTMPMNNAPGTVVTLMDTGNVRPYALAGMMQAFTANK